MKPKNEKLKDIPNWKIRWHRSLTDISAAICQAMINQNVSVNELAEELNCNREYIERILGGGINLSIKTISKLETALDMDLLEVLVDKPDLPKRK